MALAAAQVKAALLARLVAANTAAAARVWGPSRTWPLDEGDLPAIIVVPAGEEELDSEDITWPQLQVHTLPLAIQGKVRSVSDVDGAMDDLAEDILVAINDTQAHAELDPLVGCNVVARGINRNADAAGQAALGVVTVRVDAIFQTAANAPSTLI